jgi:DNA-binding NarL/FixJ family response regulator
VESVVIAAVDAIVSFKRHERDVIERVSELADKVFATGALDLLVTSYRAVPEMFAILSRSQSANDVRELVRRVGDEDIAHLLGSSMSNESDAVALLTPRQHEVYELLREGLTNREIARLLVIAETTAKLHVQHIFDKLGVRSRRTIAVRAALERSAQATSAIDDTGSGIGS